MAQDLPNSLFRPFSGPKIWPTRVIFHTHTWKYPQYACKPSFRVWHQNVFEKIPYFGLIWGQKGAQNLAHKTHFSHTLENTHNMPVNQVLWAPIENLLRKLPKTCKISNFDLFVNMVPQFWSHNFVGNIVVHIQAKYWKDRMKTEGAYDQKSPKFPILCN